MIIKNDFFFATLLLLNLAHPPHIYTRIKKNTNMPKRKDEKKITVSCK